MPIQSIIAACAYIIISMNIQAQSVEKSSSSLKPQLNHIALHVTNLSQSSRFYQQIVGLDTIPEPFHDGRHTWFAIGGGAQLHIIQQATKPVIPLKQTHVCFSVDSVPDFVELLKKNNIGWEDWPGTKSTITTRPDGVKQIYFQDPDGYWIEVNDDSK